MLEDTSLPCTSDRFRYQRGSSRSNQTSPSIKPQSDPPAATSLLRHPENLCKAHHNQLSLSHCVRPLHNHRISVSSFTQSLRLLLPAVKHLFPLKNENHLSELSVEGERVRILLDVFDINNCGSYFMWVKMQLSLRAYRFCHRIIMCVRSDVFLQVCPLQCVYIWLGRNQFWDTGSMWDR